MSSVIETNRSTLVLARGELATLQPRGKAHRISCLAGRLWVTAAGRSEDSVLNPGEEVTIAGQGTIVVEALRRATMRLEAAPSALPYTRF
jgi:hypothetical protein